MGMIANQIALDLIVKLKYKIKKKYKENKSKSTDPSKKGAKKWNAVKKSP